tara:strand:- start:9 stop:191 length:183 start_codon:yes stop_codon:yes gene_type:complete
MKAESQNFNAKELCSRKLWEIVTNTELEMTSSDELKDSLNELALRRHYLKELEQLGLLNK